MADEISHSELGHEFSNGIEDDILIEISRIFAKYLEDEADRAGFNVDCSETEDFQNMIETIINCCEEHGWFEEIEVAQQSVSI